MARLKLSSPWEIYYKEVTAMFGQDHEVHVVMDDDNMQLVLYVENARKAEALEKILPVEKEFGNVKLSIMVVPANKEKENYELGDDLQDIFNAAFYDNTAFVYSRMIPFLFDGNPLYYIVFDKVVVQYYNDDLGDINGLCSTLYQEIAKDIFKEMPGVFYCTNNEEDVIEIEY